MKRINNKKKFIKKFIILSMILSSVIFFLEIIFSLAISFLKSESMMKM